MIKDILYALSCIAFTIMIGGAVYEHLNVVPKWAAAPPVSLSMFQGTFGLKPDLFWKLIHPTIFALTVASLIAHWNSDRKENIAFVLTCYLIIIAITAIYFVPELIDITSTAYANTTDAGLVKRAKLWETLSLVRLSVLMILAVILFLGLTKSQERTKLKQSEKRKLESAF